MVSKNVTAKLAKLQQQEWDSGSDTESIAFNPEKDVIEIDRKDARAHKPKSVVKGNNESRVIYLARIPHGFYEDQMLGYFKQFGPVKRIKLARNKKTGRSKHYAFIEFQDAGVAQIVAQTMNGYRLFDHTLTCQVLPPASISKNLFRGAGKTYQPQFFVERNREKHNGDRTFEQELKRVERIKLKEKKKRRTLKVLGIDYEFAGCVAPTLAEKSVHVQFAE